MRRYGGNFIRRRWNWVDGIRHSLFRTLEFILRWIEIRLPGYGRKRLFTNLKWVLWHLKFYFYDIRCYFALIGGTVAKILVKTFIRRCWNLVYGIHPFIFRTFDVILRWFEVRLPRYVRKTLFMCFEMGFAVFKVLFLEHWMSFCVDWMYVLKILVKTFIRRCYNWVYHIRLSVFRTFEVILRWLEVRLQRYRRNCLFSGFETWFPEFAIQYL